MAAERKYVIVRSGIIARIKNFLEGHSDDFLVDSNIFPGNSGGPIISKPEMDPFGTQKSNLTPDLIGMVQSYISYNDIAYSKQTNEPRIIFSENSGLASVIPMDYVLETLDIAEKKLLKLI